MEAEVNFSFEWPSHTHEVPAAANPSVMERFTPQRACADKQGADSALEGRACNKNNPVRRKTAPIMCGTQQSQI